MLVETIAIDGITGSRYDRLLAAGWFRSRNIAFKSDLICIEDKISSVRHIRYSLESFSFKKKHSKLLRTNDAKFEIEIVPVTVTHAAEELYSLQKKRFKGFIHEKLSDIVFTDAAISFTTMALFVYADNELIAASYFDIGAKSAASLICVYHPEYAGYSLGTYTMLKEIEYLNNIGCTHYYPGYILDRPSSFDYKLALGDCQWRGNDGRWLNRLRLSDTTVAMRLDEKMAELLLRLNVMGYTPKLVRYPYFTTAYLTVGIENLLKYSCYFLIDSDNKIFGVAYDIELEEFVVFTPIPSIDCFVHLDLSNEYLNSENYEMRVMKMAEPFSFELLTSFVAADSKVLNES